MWGTTVIHIETYNHLQTMPRVSAETELKHVEYISASGRATLDFAVKDKDDYHTWEGDKEDSDWTVENIQRVENGSEDRFVIFPEEDYFTCRITYDDNGEEVAHCE
jgi:hypothetical protein